MQIFTLTCGRSFISRKSRLLRALFFLAVVSVASPASAQVNIDPPTRSFTKDGGGGSVITSGTGTWTASSGVPWITLTPRTSGNALESCIYIVASNFSADTRQGVITFPDNKTHTVTQAGYPATLSPTSASVNLNGGTGSVSITVNSGVSWSASSSAAWLTVTPSSGVSSGSVTYTVAPYGGVTTRTASLTIAGKIFPVTQLGTDVNISPRSVEKAYSSDIVQVQVTALAATAWNVTPNAPWISVVDQGNRFGDSVITLAVGTNPSFLGRTGTVTIGSATCTIVQAGTPNPSLDILPKEATADPIGAYGNVAVLATPDGPWTAQSMSPWITISQGASGSGNGNIQYVASANPTLSERTGTIRVNPPVYQPTIDLTWMLLSSVIGSSVDHSGWERNLSGSLATRFNGLTSLTMTGQDFGRGTDDSFSLCLQIELGDVNTTNRILQVLRASGSYSTVYVDDTNRLIFRSGSETLTTSLLVTAGTAYQLILTADASHAVKLYASARGSSDIALVGSKNFTAAPFPAAYVTPARITLGATQVPTPGSLTNAALNDLRIYGRALNAREVVSLYVNAGTANPYAVSPPQGSPVPDIQLNLNGNGLGHGIQSFSGATNWNRSPDRFGLPNRALQSANSGRLRSNSNSFSQVPGGFTWSQAKADAISRGGELAMPDNAAAAAEITTRGLRGWIGLTDEVTEGVFKWVDGRTATFFNWAPNEPSIYNNEDYIEVLDGGRWNDLDWSALRPYILEIEKAGLGFSSTYCYWLRVDAFPATGSAPIQSNSDGLVLAIASGPSLRILSGATDVGTYPSPLMIGQWHHVAFSGASGGITRIFVDGSEVGNTSAPGARNFGSPTFIIGGWNGAIDQVAYYNGALTSAQVRAIYNLEKPATVFHTVTQGTVTPVIAPETATLPAAGGSTSTGLTIAQNVNWTASTAVPWLTILSPESGAGSTTVEVSASANPTVYGRQGTVLVGGKTLTITQAGLDASVQGGDLIFATDGGSGWVQVSTEGNGQWQASSNSSWLTIALGATGTGSGSVFIVADPYTQTSQARTGSLTIAGKTVYVTQRGYTLSVNPQIGQIGSNALAGEFGVAAPLGAVWEAIVSHPWITIVGGTSGVGSGVIQYSVASNTTGAPRTGRILVSGAEYTITQTSSLLVTLQEGTGGTATGGGPYQTNATAVLTATPANGFVFSHWSGDAVGSANPLSLAVNSDKSVMAVFIPSSAATKIADTAVSNVIKDPNPYGLFRTDQVRAMALGRPLLTKDPLTGKMKIELGLKQSSNLQNWTDLNIRSSELFLRNGKVQIEVTPENGAAFYKVYGSELGQ